MRGKFRQAKAVVGASYYCVIELEVEFNLSSQRLLEAPMVPPRLQSGIVFGLDYAARHINGYAEGWEAEIVVFQFHYHDTPVEIVAVCTANAALAAYGYHPAASILDSIGAVGFPKFSRGLREPT